MVLILGSWTRCFCDGMKASNFLKSNKYIERAIKCKTSTVELTRGWRGWLELVRRPGVRQNNKSGKWRQEWQRLAVIICTGNLILVIFPCQSPSFLTIGTGVFPDDGTSYKQTDPNANEDGEQPPQFTTPSSICTKTVSCIPRRARRDLLRYGCRRCRHRCGWWSAADFAIISASGTLARHGKVERQKTY